MDLHDPFLELDIWLTARPHGLGYAAHSEDVGFLVEAEWLPLLERRVERELSIQAMAQGRDRDYVARASMRPQSIGRDPRAPLPREAGARCVGRVMVVEARAGSSRDRAPFAA